ncbi:ABC exporter membrane fusion protein [Myxacorys almedinensis]|uniref:HlyD family efflux transporter periplasmic adaptor subunit n=1 Tax=Myxacorys almedinensis A TaxID=2690445 RepID=A0A8J8CLB2_9CYAN|nr:ABC exporter membrane fusion protein [Myxacorys almedinensis]NDJ19431.1 HlyD family efflux transporter periplasmic adaptor subunit [Myxacorys almedinensis A]
MVIAGLVLSGATFQYLFQFRQSSPASVTPSNAKPKAISALGYLRPEGEVIYLSPPTSLNGAGVSRLGKLLVKEGSTVKTGQVTAILDSQGNLQTSLNLALEDVAIARANLAKVKAGAKTGELDAQKATIAQLIAEQQGQLTTQGNTIARLEAELENGQTEHQRYLELFQSGAIAASQLDSTQLTMTTAQAQLDEAKAKRTQIEASLTQQIKAAQATLSQISEVRPTDVQAAQAEVNRAIANVAKAQADLELAYIRSPIDGQVLKIHTRPGEVVGNKGIVAIGHTEQMNVVAEVYELDVHKIRVGQKAKIASSAFAGNLEGTVTDVGLQVNPQDVLATDPTADVNRRIVEVKIRLNEPDSQKVSTLTNLQVSVVIDDDLPNK